MLLLKTRDIRLHRSSGDYFRLFDVWLWRVGQIGFVELMNRFALFLKLDHDVVRFDSKYDGGVR